MKRVNEKRTFSPADGECLSSCVDFIRAALEKAGMDRRLLTRTVLLAEETASMLLEHIAPGKKLTVRVHKTIGDLAVQLSAPGGECTPFDANAALGDDAGEETAQDTIRSILLRAYGEKFKFTRRNGVNTVRILAGQSERSTLRLTFLALALGIVVGLLLRALPPQAGAFCSHWLFDPVKTVFMNALRVIIAPVVFFSITTCIAQFKNLRELGRIGAKVMGMYVLTTLIAVLLSFFVFSAFRPGTPGAALTGALTGEEVSVDTNVDTSILTTIVNIVPSNYLAPFFSSDTLQLIFLAVLTGAAIGMIGRFSAMLRDLVEALNSLFLTITSMITRFIPAAVFCSVALMLTDAEGSALLSLLGVTGTVILTIALMLCVYGLLVQLIARLNLFRFFKNCRSGMLTSFTLCSSSAAMPTNMRVCTEKLGVSTALSSFSIPLGATVNMDGSCILLMVMGMFLARAYGVTLNASTMFSLMITIVLLSLGAPGVPGAAIVCLGVVLGQIGVPVSAIGLIMPIAAFLDMFVTMLNTTGDMAVTTIVGSTEKLVDTDVYYGRKKAA